MTVAGRRDPIDGLATDAVPSPLPPPSKEQAGGLSEPESDTSLFDVGLLRRQALNGPSQAATDAQHRKGKLTVRERIEILFDEGRFYEVEQFRRHEASGFGIEESRPLTDGVITGWGYIHGRRVFAYAHDFRIFGGALGKAHAEKVHKILDLAAETGHPIVSLCDGAGARIQEGVTALAGYGGIFRRNVEYSGRIPQISVILGPCAGGSAYSPALTDFVFAVDGTAQMFVTGPDVVKAVTGESVTHNELGGASVHASKSGVASFIHPDEQSCLEDVRYLISYLPDNCSMAPPAYQTGDSAERACPELNGLVPAEPHRSYDVRDVIECIADMGEFLEVHERWAPNVVCAFARISGRSVGILANQPNHLAGALDIASSEKAARFVNFCDGFNIPIVTLVDVPGFLPGVDQEHSGIIRHGAKLLYAYCSATVPRIQVILRKAYGGAYIVMDSRSVGADLSYAWPGNEVAVMGAEGATNVIHRRQLAASEDPDSLRSALVREYKNELMTPSYAAERGLVDDVIEPHETRRILAEGLAMLRDKNAGGLQRKHALPPM